MKSAAKLAMFMTILTLASKGLGFLREMVIAYYYGASYITDSYVMANAIPGIIFGGIFGAIATAYMPLYAKFVEQDGEIAGNRFTSESVNLLLVVSVVSSIVGIVFSDQLVAIFASGFTVLQTSNSVHELLKTFAKTCSPLLPCKV